VADTLVIGYGSDLRGDDAAGRHVVRRVADLGLSGVATLEVHQLTPELATALGSHRRVVFVDAAAGVDEVAAVAVSAAPEPSPGTHHATPAGLLALARSALGAEPGEAVLVTVPAAGFDLGAGLSPLARRGVARATEVIAGIAGAAATREAG